MQNLVTIQDISCCPSSRFGIRANAPGRAFFVFLAELPQMAEAMKASIALKRITDISFFTAAAMPIEDFDQMVDAM